MKMELHIRGHLIAQIQIRFGKKTKEEILEFIKQALDGIKIKKENNLRISFINEEFGTDIKARRHPEVNGYLLCTIYPLDEASHYQIRGKSYKGLAIKDYSEHPLIFARTNLQKENTIKTIKELKRGK